jgi:hypothetical protein
MKASVAYKTLDNITVVMLAFKNFKDSLSEDFEAVNNPSRVANESKYKLSNNNIYLIGQDMSKESGQVGSTPAAEEQSQQRVVQPPSMGGIG